MCKKCEMKGITMRLRYLAIPALDEMKEHLASEMNAWKKLFESGWDEQDLTQRAYAHLMWTKREAEETNRPHFVGNAKAFLGSMARGFLKPFNKEDFMPANDDQHYELKRNALNGIEVSAKFFGQRVPSVVWNSFAYLSVRDEPEVSRSILKEAEALPHHYGIVDTMLHGTAKCYKGMMFMQSNFFQATGYILDHNCDCDCSLVNLFAGIGHQSVVFNMGKDKIYEATQSTFTHLLAESHLILNCKLPFEYTVTKEAALLPGIEVEEETVN